MKSIKIIFLLVVTFAVLSCTDGNTVDEKADSSEPKVLSEGDFYFDKKTLPYKTVIIAGVNKVHRENSRCKEIDPSSAYISSSKGTVSDPVFYVTCGSGANVFNAFSQNQKSKQFQLCLLKSTLINRLPYRNARTMRKITPHTRAL